MERISFVVITYNREVECLDTIQNIAGNKYYNDDCELIIINNNNKHELNLIIDFISNNTKKSIRLINSPENLGVAGGRNLGTRNSTGDILIFIDDDAVFETDNYIVDILETFRQNPTCGIIAFKSKDYFKNVMVLKEFPHRKKDLVDNPMFYTYYFIGVGHAIRKSVFEKAGFYPDDFFYGMEEYDLSYRALDKGFDIIYIGAISVLHKNSKMGRKPSDFVKMKYSENKIKVAMRNLPSAYVFTHWILWSGKYLIISGFNIFRFISLQISLIKYVRKVDRNIISNSTIRKIKRDLNGNPYY